MHCTKEWKKNIKRVNICKNKKCSQAFFFKLTVKKKKKKKKEKKKFLEKQDLHMKVSLSGNWYQFLISVLSTTISYEKSLHCTTPKYLKITLWKYCLNLEKKNDSHVKKKKTHVVPIPQHDPSRPWHSRL